MVPAKKEALTADRHISNALQNHSKYKNDVFVEEHLGTFGYRLYDKLSKMSIYFRKAFEHKFYHLSKLPTIIFPFILSPWISYTLYKKFKEYDIVVLHGHRVIVFVGCLGGIILTKVLNIISNKKPKFIFHAHNSYSAIFTILRRTFLSFSNMFMDGIIFMTKDDFKKCKKLVKIPSFVLYNPVPPDLIKEKCPPEEKRDIDFLFVSRFSKHKRHELIIKALSRIEVPKNKRLKVMLMGSIQDNFQRVKQIAEEFKKTKKPIELKIVANAKWNEIKNAYKHAKWFIFPSTEREGFPIVLLEAAAHGVPIICSDYPMYKEIGDDNFIYFKDEKELSQIIYDIINKKIKWNVWHKKVIKLLNKYHPKKIAEEFDKKINLVINP